MKSYLYFLLVFLVACAESGGSKPAGTSTAAEPPKSAEPAPAKQAAPPPPKRDKLENSPLVWKPTTNIASLGAIELTGLSNVKLQLPKMADSRKDPMLLGTNKEKSPPRIITTSDDVPAFVTQHMKEIIAATGINVVDSGGTHVLKADLNQFYVDETDTYKGDVRMVVTLTSAGGQTLWSGTTGGGAQRFGRSYKAENYYETLSDSLIEATYSLLRNPSFTAALAKK